MTLTADNKKEKKKREKHEKKDHSSKIQNLATIKKSNLLKCGSRVFFRSSPVFAELRTPDKLKNHNQQTCNVYRKTTQKLLGWGKTVSFHGFFNKFHQNVSTKLVFSLDLN